MTRQLKWHGDRKQREIWNWFPVLKGTLLKEAVKHECILIWVVAGQITPSFVRNTH